MTRIALVSGSDANYYPLLREWIHSVQRFPESKDIDICIIDAGLSAEQKAELKTLVKHVVNPPWPERIPEEKVRGKEYLKACVCRPFIPKMFPGYDVYMWMDSDTWVQNWKSVDVFLKGALEKKDSIILTSTADRHYQRQIRVNWLWRWPYRVASFYFSNGRRAFGFKTAKELLSQYVLLAGCFAMSAGAPHWKRWQELVEEAAVRGRVFPAEQLSLGVLVYIEKFKAEILPAYTHWVLGTPPMWDSALRQFVEPFIPHEPIGVLHLSGVDEMRSDRGKKVPYATRDGAVTELNCRYPHFDGGKVSLPERK